MTSSLAKHIGRTLALLSLLQQPLARAAAEEVCSPQSTPNPAPPLEQAPTSCDARNWSSVASHVRQQVTLMKIAASKADFKNMSQYRRELEVVLNRCRSAPAPYTAEQLVQKICDVECTVQRASAALFNVSELPYLDSAGLAMKVASNDIVDDARQGLTLIDEAMKYLASGNRGGDGVEGKTSASSFNSFLQDSGRLQAMKVRLLIALGDSFYKNISRTRATTLKKKAQNALQIASESTKPGQETDYAEVYYEEASWVLQEALIDIPLIQTDGNAGSGDGNAMVVDFGRLRREMESLQLDVEQRLSSINKGFLFLNIDPESFTTLTTDALQSLLQNQLQEITGLEDRISAIVVAWQDKKTDEARRQIDAQNMRDERTLELKGMQIASYEDFASEVTQKFQGLISQNGYEQAKLDGQVEVIEKQQMLANYRFELAKLSAETKNQIELINRQKELDLTVLSKERHQEQRDQYKWLVDVSLTTMNLQLQINDYTTQVSDFEAQIRIKDLEKQSVEANIGSRNALIAVEQNKITEYQTMIKKLNEQKSTVHQAHLVPLQYQVCALAQEYSKYFGSAPNTGKESCSVASVPYPTEQYWTDVLKIRREYFGANGDSGLVKQNYDKLRACMGGEGSCEGLSSSVKDLIKKAYETEKTIVNSTLDEKTTKMKNMLSDMISSLETTQNTVTGLKAAFAGINAGLGTAYIVLAGKIAGLPPAMNLGEQAKAAYEVAMSLLERGTDAYQTYAQYQADIENLKLQKEAFTQELRVAKKMLEKEEIARDRAMADIIGKGLELEKENLLVRAEASASILEAKNWESQIAAERPRIQAEINDLLAQIDALNADNNLVAYELKTFESQIEGARNQINSLQFDISGLNSNVQGISSDMTRLGRLKGNAVAQRDLVAETQRKVSSLNSQVSLETSIIEDLQQQQKNNLTALSEKQIAQIEAVFQLSETQIQTAMGYVNQTLQKNIEQLGLTENTKALTQDMNKKLEEIFSQVKAKRCEMLQFASSRPAAGSQDLALFIASEEVITNLTQGVPEYIRSKKSRLDYVNYLYNLYRNRVTLVSDIAGRDVKQNYGYIQNSTDLQQFVKDICTKNSGTNPGSFVCSPSSLMFDDKPIPVLAHTFRIPSESGFMSRLLRKGVARFEITPAALQGVDSLDNATVASALANNGYFQLWDASMSSMYNMSVVNLALMAEMDPVLCSNKVTLNVRHLGYGSRYLPISSQDATEAYPVLSITAARNAPLIVWDANQTQAFDYYFKGLVTNSGYTINNFPEEIQNYGAASDKQALQFLGAPLVGTYEISIDNRDPWIASCLSGRSLNLGVAFTKPAINL